MAQISFSSSGASDPSSLPLFRGVTRLVAPKRSFKL